MARTNTRRMNKLRQDFFEEGKALAEKGDPAAGCWLGPVCYLAGIPIDYTVPMGTTDESHHLDHYHVVSEHPELQEDPSNFRHAHKLCNERRKTTIPTGGLGETVPNWW